MQSITLVNTSLSASTYSNISDSNSLGHLAHAAGSYFYKRFTGLFSLAKTYTPQLELPKPTEKAKPYTGPYALDDDKFNRILHQRVFIDEKLYDNTQYFDERGELAYKTIKNLRQKDALTRNHIDITLAYEPWILKVATNISAPVLAMPAYFAFPNFSASSQEKTTLIAWFWEAAAYQHYKYLGIPTNIFTQACSSHFSALYDLIEYCEKEKLFCDDPQLLSLKQPEKFRKIVDNQMERLITQERDLHTFPWEFFAAFSKKFIKKQCPEYYQRELEQTAEVIAFIQES